MQILILRWAEISRFLHGTKFYTFLFQYNLVERTDACAQKLHVNRLAPVPFLAAKLM